MNNPRRSNFFLIWPLYLPHYIRIIWRRVDHERLHAFVSQGGLQARRVENIFFRLNFGCEPPLLMIAALFSLQILIHIPPE